jgi:hypothetical protein
MCLQVTEYGKVHKMFLDPDGSHVSDIPAVAEHDHKLFLGNLKGDYVSYVDLEY